MVLDTGITSEQFGTSLNRSAMLSGKKKKTPEGSDQRIFEDEREKNHQYIEEDYSK